MKFFNDNRFRGFTLVELLVVVAVTAILLNVCAALFGNILRSSNCPIGLNEVNQNGKHIIDVIERKVRAATDIQVYQGGKYISVGEKGDWSWTCSDPLQCEFVVVNPNGLRYTRFLFSQESSGVNGTVLMGEGDDLIALQTNPNLSRTLISNDAQTGVSIVAEQPAAPSGQGSPHVTIDTSGGKPPVVEVFFILSSGVLSDRSHCNVRVPFQTSVSMRKY